MPPKRIKEEEASESLKCKAAKGNDIKWNELKWKSEHVEAEVVVGNENEM